MVVFAGLAIVLFLAIGQLTAAPAPKAEFESLFDGKTLEGWKAPDMTFWKVEDGAITGEVTKDHKPTENVFIVWQGGKAGDFELHFKYRLFGAAANSGMQFRSEVAEHGLVHGYQADMSGDGKWTGGIYDEYGPRGSLAARGESNRFNEAGEKTVGKLPDGDPFAGAGNAIDQTQWCDYVIRAEGEHITLTINGKTTAELFDADKRQRLEGVFAMPIIPAEMKVQYKDIQLKRL